MYWVIKRTRPEFLNIVGLFFIWKVITLGSLFIATKFVPINSPDRFLGGTYKNFSLLPEFFSWANFDGEHFISIAVNGYKSLQYAFFPLYPSIVGFFSKFFVVDEFSSFFSPIFIGIVLSNLFFLTSLIIFYDLIRIDYNRDTAFFTIIALIVFPTSFFFGAVYSESLFLLLTLLAFYFSRQNKWMYSSLFGFFALLTRVFGIVIFLSFLPELFKRKQKNILWIFSIPLGLIVYMIYLKLTTGDPLAFYNQQLIVGEQHQQGIVILPQVLYRYLKIILSIRELNYIYQTVFLELGTALLFVFLSIYGYMKKMRSSYMIFLVLGFILPTIQGSFSSLPRYVIVLFPAFILLGIILNKFPKPLKIIYILFSGALLLLESGLFFRGYWIS